MNTSKTISLLNQIQVDIASQSSDLSTINTELTQKKVIFNAKLTDGTNEYLPLATYSSSPIIFEWQNDKGTPVYITNYRFVYVEGSEPNSGELYHSTAWESKIGAVDSAGTDFEAPYITKESNLDYYMVGNPNPNKMSWTSDPGWIFNHVFTEAPIEIGISRKFGHYIASDFAGSAYNGNPVGIITGYYFDS